MWIRGVAKRLWREVCNVERVSRYSAAQITDVLEALARLPLPTEPQIHVLTNQLVTPDQMAKTRMPQFVLQLDSLSRIPYRDKWTSIQPCAAWKVFQNDGSNVDPGVYSSNSTASNEWSCDSQCTFFSVVKFQNVASRCWNLSWIWIIQKRIGWNFLQQRSCVIHPKSHSGQKQSCCNATSNKRIRFLVCC